MSRIKVVGLGCWARIDFIVRWNKKLRIKFVLYGAFLFSPVVQGYALATCNAFPPPPFEERVSTAKYIFVGTPVSESAIGLLHPKWRMHSSSNVDMTVTFKVSGVFKGQPGSNIEVSYKLATMDIRTRFWHWLFGNEYCEAPDMTQSFAPSILKGAPELVYVREMAGVLTLSPQFGGGPIEDGWIRKEIETLSKMK